MEQAEQAVPTADAIAQRPNSGPNSVPTSVPTSGPMAPTNIADTGLDQAFLVNLIAKGMYLENLEEIGQITQATKLPDNIVSAVGQEMADRKLIYAVGTAGAGPGAAVRYQLTQDGQKLAKDACTQSQYFGPAPVRLEQYKARIKAQSIAGEHISKDDITEAFADIVVPGILSPAWARRSIQATAS